MSRSVLVSLPSCALLAFLLAPGSALAQDFPETLEIEVVLDAGHRDTGGGVSRERDFLVRLTDESGGDLHHEELECGIEVVGRDGRLDLVLGDAGVPIESRFELPLWIELYDCAADACSVGDASRCEGSPFLREPLIPHAYAWRTKYASEADHALTADDADTVDGQHADEFMPADRDDWVDEVGDTMTGPLVLHDDPTEPLEAATKHYVDSRPDRGVPPGYSILGETTVAPAGYTATGHVVQPHEPWRRLAPMPRPRSGHAAVVAGGKIHLIGARESDHWQAVDVYDPGTDSWRPGTGRPPVQFRETLSAAAVGETLYVFLENETWIQDPGTRWRPGARMPTPRTHAVALAHGGRIHVLGGGEVDTARTHEIYDPATDSWSEGPPMRVGRWRHGGTVLDGELVVAGGVRPRPGGNDILASVEALDLTSGTWRFLTSLPRPHFEPAVVALGGRLVVVGGHDGWYGGGAWGGGGDSGVQVPEIYDPETTEWTRGTASLVARSAPAAVVLDGAVHVLGGYVDDSNTSSGHRDALSTHEVWSLPTELHVFRKD